ncbi:MAG: class I SAM-dependent methyltransferase [Acidovorax sp.]|nr:class I SAM-dependent methyltransferase [Acidovorax sp.]
MPTTDCPSPSALRVATARAAHQILENERVFDDPFAIASLGSSSAAALLRAPLQHNDVPARSMRAGIVARACFAEDRLLDAIAAGTEQYAVVGAGLDTWALRMAQLLPAISIFELDLPDMQAWKAALYARNGWRVGSRLQHVGLDLRSCTAVEGLAQGGADLKRPMHLSILGVWVYLDDAALSREIDALQQLAPGSTLSFDYRLDEAQLHPMERVMMQFTAQMMAAGGEPWLSSSTLQRISAQLHAAGFAVEEDVGPPELNARYFAERKDGLQIAGGGFRYVSAIKA